MGGRLSVSFRKFGGKTMQQPEQIDHIVWWNGVVDGQDSDLFSQVEFQAPDPFVVKRIEAMKLLNRAGMHSRRVMPTPKALAD
jgi:hypothetical protein